MLGVELEETLLSFLLEGFKKRTYKLGKESMARHQKGANSVAIGYPSFLASNA